MAGEAVLARRPDGVRRPAGDDESGLPAPSAQNGVFEVLDRTVRGGASVRVKIISPRNGMHVALTDAQSHEVAGTDAGDQTTEVTLRAPAVSVPARYTVVASFTDGFGQESIVEPVTVVP